MSDDKKPTDLEILATKYLSDWKAKLAALGATSTYDQDKAFYQGALAALLSGVLK